VPTGSGYGYVPQPHAPYTSPEGSGLALESDNLVRVVAAVLERGDTYLVCKRPDRKRHGGLWEFPGGKIQDGESTFDAVRRELREELSLEVTEVGETLQTVQDPGSPFLIEFVTTKARGTPLAREHDLVEWRNVRDLLTLPLAPADRSFAEGLQRP